MRTATLFAAGLLAGAVSAQGVITRMNAGVSHFYYEGALSIQDALDEAENDAGVDTILLGGGSYVMAADIFVNSPVVLIGTGIHPDSSLAYNNNGRTEIDGGSAIELYIDENATGSQFHGIALVNGVDIAIGLPGGQLSSTDADSILFSRCEIPGLYLGYGSAGSLADDTYIQECVIGYLDISESNNAIVRNSVLLNLVNAIPGNDLLVENCIFQNVNLNQNAGAQYERNVFLLNTGSVYNLSQQSSFNENLFVGTGGGFNVNYTGGNGFSGNGRICKCPIAQSEGGSQSISRLPPTRACELPARSFSPRTQSSAASHSITNRCIGFRYTKRSWHFSRRRC